MTGSTARLVAATCVASATLLTAWLGHGAAARGADATKRDATKSPAPPSSAASNANSDTPSSAEDDTPSSAENDTPSSAKDDTTETPTGGPATGRADHAAAQALFDEARRLIAAKDYDRACPKLAESMRLDPAPGTQLNLADCYERVGKTASAWANFRDVEVRARRDGNEKREKVARERAEALAPRLSRVILLGPDPSRRPKGLRILRDDTELGVGVLGSALPIDPGEHRIAAEAKGKLPWSTKLVVDEEGKTYRVKVPLLADAPQPERAIGTGRLVGLALGGAGAIGLGVGLGLGSVAIAKNEESLTHCLPDDPNQCFPEGLALRDEARSTGNVSTGLVVLGASLLSAGTIVFFATGGPTPDTGGTKASATTWRLGAAPHLGGVSTTLRAAW